MLYCVFILKRAACGQIRSYQTFRLCRSSHCCLWGCCFCRIYEIKMITRPQVSTGFWVFFSNCFLRSRQFKVMDNFLFLGCSSRVPEFWFFFSSLFYCVYEDKTDLRPGVTQMAEQQALLEKPIEAAAHSDRGNVTHARTHTRTRTHFA